MPRTLGASRRARARGMTLIEVMVSIAIMVMMMTSVWASFKSTMRGVQRNRVLQERAQTIRGALSRISAELSMSYLSFNRPLDEQRHFTLFEGRDEFERDNVTFSTFAHLRLRQDANESDQAVIQYFVAGDPEDRSRQHLYRRESRRLMGDLPEDMENYFPAYVACEDVEVFDLKYFDLNRQEWVDSWATTMNSEQPDRLPTRVWIKLGVREGEEIVTYHVQTALVMQEKIDLGR